MWKICDGKTSFPIGEGKTLEEAIAKVEYKFRPLDKIGKVYALRVDHKKIMAIPTYILESGLCQIVENAVKIGYIVRPDDLSVSEVVLDAINQMMTRDLCLEAVSDWISAEDLMERYRMMKEESL